MKNLVTMTHSEVRMAVFQLTVSQMKSLCIGIREFISGKKHIPQEQLADMVRKESIIQKELMRRKILTKGTRQEFDNWINQFRTKRIY